MRFLGSQELKIHSFADGHIHRAEHKTMSRPYWCNDNAKTRTMFFQSDSTAQHSRVHRGDSDLPGFLKTYKVSLANGSCVRESDVQYTAIALMDLPVFTTSKQ